MTSLRLAPVVALIPLVITSGCSYGRSVPDSELKALFMSNQENLSTLRTLLYENPSIVSSGMSAVRVLDGQHLASVRSNAKYRYENSVYDQIGRIQESLGIRGGVYHCPNNADVIFMFVDCRTESHGIMPVSWCKGLAYSPTPPSPLLPSLDDSPDQTDDMGRAYAAIADDWYIIREHWSDPRARCGGPNSA